jgi:hypothetical protein
MTLHVMCENCPEITFETQRLQHTDPFFHSLEIWISYRHNFHISRSSILCAPTNMTSAKLSSKTKFRKQPLPVSQFKPKAKQKTQAQSSMNENFKPPHQETPFPDLPVLLLSFDNSTHQRQTLSRIAAFYEHKTYQGIYIPLDDGRCKGLGHGYLGYNLPATAIKSWAQVLAYSVVKANESKEENWTKEETHQGRREREWRHKGKGYGGWRDMCNEGEIWLLEMLKMKGWLNIDAIIRQANQPTSEISSFDAQIDTSKRRNGERKSTGAGSDGYLVSYVSSSPLTKIHELQHALYHFSPSLRECTASLFNSNEILEKRQKERIRWELGRRGYIKNVWLDEFQAYAVRMYHGDTDGFGNEMLDAVVRRVGALIEKFCTKEVEMRDGGNFSEVDEKTRDGLGTCGSSRKTERQVGAISKASRSKQP